MHDIEAARQAQVADNSRTAGGEDRHDARIRHIIESILWVLGLILLTVAGVLTHFHPGPWPGELEFSRWVQSLNLGPWASSWLNFVSALNDPIPAGIALGLWFFGMLLARWFRDAILLILAVGVGNGIDALIGDLVVRPRPSPKLVHVDNLLKYNSFPSGHSCHVVIYYGFLLYLSFTKPVREWRYHWFLLPLQIFAVLNILTVGFARIQEGEHWVSDVLGGYLSGTLWLFLFIILYRWVTNVQYRRRAKRLEEQANSSSKPISV